MSQICAPTGPLLAGRLVTICAPTGPLLAGRLVTDSSNNRVSRLINVEKASQLKHFSVNHSNFHQATSCVTLQATSSYLDSHTLHFLSQDNNRTMRNIFKSKRNTATVQPAANDNDDVLSSIPTMPSHSYVELGTIQYVNLTSDARHGDYQIAIDIAAQTGKPIFANFVEWSG